MSALDDKPFPRGPLTGALLLVAVTLGSVGAARLGLLPGPDEPSTRPVESVARATASTDVRFYDRDDGAVVVEAVAGGAPTIIEPDSGGFVRGVLRGLARDRKALGIGTQPAFRITQWDDGQVTLEDTATGKRVNLNGFGPTNKDAFTALLRPVGSAA